MRKSTFTFDKAKKHTHAKRKYSKMVTKDVQCFICDGVIRGKGVQLLMGSTPYTNTGLPSKIGQLMGDGFMVIVAVTDMLCKKCSSLINHLDKLEYDTDIVKKALTGYLKVKYQLRDNVQDEIDGLHQLLPNPLHEDMQSLNGYFSTENVDQPKDEDKIYTEITSRKDVKPTISELMQSLLQSDEIKLEHPSSLRNKTTSLTEDAAPGEYRLLKRKKLQQSWNAPIKQPLETSDENQQPEQPILKLYKCTLCSFKSPHLDSFMAHLNLHNKKIYYKCSECLQKFHAQEDVEHHVLEVHGVPDVQYENRTTMADHRIPTQSSPLHIYECNVCQYQNSDKRSFSQHLKRHIKKELFYCALCPKKFRHKITLKRHLTTHETFKCGLCSMTFQNKASLVHHFQYHRDEGQDENLESNYEAEYLIEDEAEYLIEDEAEYLIEEETESHEVVDLVEEEDVIDMPLVETIQPDVSSEEVKIKMVELPSQMVDPELAKEAEYDQIEVLLEKMHADEPCKGELCETPSIEGETVDNTKNDQSNVKEEQNILEPEVIIKSNTSEQFQVDTTVQSNVIDDNHIKEYLENSNNYLDESQSDIDQDENVKKEEFVNKTSDLFSFLNDGSLVMEQTVKSDEIVADEKIIPFKDDKIETSDEIVKTEHTEVPPKAKVKRKIYVCSLCGLRTPSETHMKRHFKCHMALQRKTYQCQICERVLTTRSNLKRHLANHENCQSGEIQCNICFTTLTDRLHLRHHLERNHPETHQCSFCDHWFVSKKLCRAHELTHPERAAHHCEQCGEAFVTYGRLKTHQEIMHSDPDHTISENKTFKCHICYKILTTYHNLKRHLRNHEKCSGPVTCSVCNLKLADKLHLRQHVENKHPENHQCSFCHKIFANKKSCKAHELTHPERFVFKCEVCEKVFLAEARLKRHKDVMHRDPHCRMCGKEISNPLKLLDHERRHERHKVKFPCDQCSKVFRTPSGLKYHMSVHTGKYAVYCEICGKGLHSEVVLEEHKATHTKEVRYMCELCGRKFSSNSTYRMHRLWHDNPLPYKCNICERKFKHTSILAVHKRRAHTGERPYKCPFCSLTFSVSSTLNKHIILHTKQYPYRCDQCGKGFTTRTKIARHLAKAHNDYEMLNTKKKMCEYKMVLMPSELPELPPEQPREPIMAMEMKQEQEEVHVAPMNAQEEEVHMTMLGTQVQNDLCTATLNVEDSLVQVATLNATESDVCSSTLTAQGDLVQVATLNIQEESQISAATLNLQEEDEVHTATLNINEQDQVHVAVLNVQEQEEVNGTSLQVHDQETVVETSQPSLFAIFQQDLQPLGSG